MAAVPVWMLGRNVTSVVAVLQTVAASTGVLADSGTGSDTAALVSGAVGLVDEIDLTASKVTENISALTRPRANVVSIARRDQLVLTEILRQGAGSALLANLWFSGEPNGTRIARFTFTRAGNSWTGYLRMTAYTEDYQRGKNVGRMTLMMIDPGQANTVYA